MAGRVLSRANENALRAAVTTLLAVLDQVAGDVAGETEEAVTEAGESLVEDVAIDLVEARRDGTARLRLIGPGWGSSGYYPAAVLERDGPMIFRSGTKMYWNHPTPTQEAERPEGDLNDLAAELTSDARWEDGEKGPGLYANARVFGSHKAAVAELAPHIGVSIRAAGRALLGEAEGRKGRIIQALTNARSIDFVTEPGAGGRIVEVSEAARGVRNADCGVQNTDPQSAFPIPHFMSKDNVSLSHGEENQGMELQEQLDAAQARVVELEAQAARLNEALQLRSAQDVVREELAAQRLPDVTRRRLSEALAVNPPLVNGAIDTEALRVRVREAATAEVQYLAEAGVGSGQIRNAGSQAGAVQEDAAAQDRMVGAFRALGLSESAAKVAVAGRH